MGACRSSPGADPRCRSVAIQMVANTNVDGGWSIATILAYDTAQSTFKITYDANRLIAFVRLSEDNYSPVKSADDMSWVSLSKPCRRRS